MGMEQFTGEVDPNSLQALVGKILVRVEVNADRDEIEFEAITGERWRMYHRQDCCESVSVEDVVGDLADLCFFPVLAAEEVTNSQENPPGVTKGHQDSFTWTFYKFRTFKGYVDIRWYGESNGYYSESVDFERIAPPTC